DDLVTGVQTCALPISTVLELAKEGSDVAVQYNRGKELALSALEKVQGLGRKAVAIQADVTDHRSCRSLASQTLASLGRIDLVVRSEERRVGKGCRCLW